MHALFVVFGLVLSCCVIAVSPVVKLAKCTSSPKFNWHFGFRPPSDIITDRIKTFCTKYKSCDNQLHKLSQLPL